MYIKILIIIYILIAIFIAGCSNMRGLIYRPDINQGNYLSVNEIKKVYVGMTQQQVTYILGTPMMSDPFGTNTWFYVFRKQLKDNKLTQQTLVLKFNNDNILTNIVNQPTFSSTIK